MSYALRIRIIFAGQFVLVIYTYWRGGYSRGEGTKVTIQGDRLIEVILWYSFVISTQKSKPMTKHSLQWCYTFIQELFADRSIDIIARHSKEEEKEPFFLYLAFQSIHWPTQVPDKYLEPCRQKRLDRRTCCGLSSWMVRTYVQYIMSSA